MQHRYLSVTVLVALGMLTASGAALGESAPPPASYPVTSTAPQSVRDFQRGMRAFYLGHHGEAIRAFEAATRRDPSCAMAYWGLSRVYQAAGQETEAQAASGKAVAQSANADDREQRLITAWAKLMKGVGQPAAEPSKATAAARSDATDELTIYPDDVDGWLLRGYLAESPLRATPYYLAALKIEPEHPFREAWKLTVPPAPDVVPAATHEVPKYTGPEIPLFEGLGMLSYPVTTSNPKAQAYFEQGLRLSHAYVNPSFVKNGAEVNFREAITLDPDCAMAHWGLSFCYDTQGDGRDRVGASKEALNAANRALDLAIQHGTDKERRITAARVLQLGGKDKRQAFLDALDGAIAAYPEDVELWVWRGKSFGDYGEGDPVPTESIPYQLAAHRLRPEHPAPNHELVHAYEEINRPALGWPYTEGFRKSAPNMPHANHMQAHLAMRLGRWQDAIDCTRASRQKALEGFPELSPAHHIDILVRALAHEGRFREAEAEPKAYRDGLPWARLLQLKADQKALDDWAANRRSVKAEDGFYIGAVAKLDAGDLTAAEPFVQHIEERWKKNNRGELYRYSEVKGRYLVQTGNADEGLKLLRDAAAKAVNDYGLHSWGGGSYMLEVWGESALRAHHWDEAEQAFSEALAHEHGSIIGALGLQVVAEQKNRSELAADYTTRAAAIWKDADSGALQRQLERLRKLASGSVARN